VFKQTIIYALLSHYPEMAKAIIDEVLSATEVQIEESKIAVDLALNLPTAERHRTIKLIIEKDIEDLNLLIIQNMPFLQEKIPAREMAEIVLMILRAYP
jgi:hypothetical protein